MSIYVEFLKKLVNVLGAEMNDKFLVQKTVSGTFSFYEYKT